MRRISFEEAGGIECEDTGDEERRENGRIRERRSRRRHGDLVVI